MKKFDLTDYDSTIDALRTLESVYATTQVDLSTPEGLEDAKDAAKKFQKLRTGVDKIRKGANEEAQRHIAEVNEKAKSILDRIEPLELRFSEPLKERKRAYERILNKLERSPQECENASAVYISERLTWIESIDTNQYPEFRSQLHQIVQAIKDEVTDMLTAAHIKEAERKAEQEKLRKLAIENSIESMKATVFEAIDWDKRRIEEAIDYLIELTFSPDDYHDRDKEAETTRDNVVQKLRALHKNASETKEEEEAQETSLTQYSVKQVETLESLLYLVYGDVAFAERILEAIVNNKIPNVTYNEFEQ